MRVTGWERARNRFPKSFFAGTGCGIYIHKMVRVPAVPKTLYYREQLQALDLLAAPAVPAVPAHFRFDVFYIALSKRSGSTT